MHVADCLAYLQELLVLVDGRGELSEIVVKDTSRVVSSALITGLAGAFASKGEDVVILEALLRSNAVIRVLVTHLQTSLLVHNCTLELSSPKSNR